MSIINCQYKFDTHFFYANLNTNGQTQTNERKRIMSEIKDQEAEVKACEACAEEAEKNAAAAEATAPAVDDAAKAAAKKKNAMIVRCVIWGIVLIGVVCFFIFKKDIMEYMRRGKIVAQITEDSKRDLGIAPFAVKYIGDNKYEVTFEDPAKAKRDNKVVIVYDVQKHELSRATDNDDAIWDIRKRTYAKSKRAKKPAAEAPAEPAKE